MSSMRKLLIIVDNDFLYEGVKRILKEKSILEVEFRHSIGSPLSSHVDFEKGNYKIDVNKEIEFIKSSFAAVLSVHCFQFFPPELVRSVKCFNLHPGYNPMNRGWYPQVFAIINGLHSGATLHEIDEKLDNGNIIERRKENVFLYDTSLDVYQRVLQIELELFEKHIVGIMNGVYEVYEPETGGNFFTKKDFNKLLQIDLNETGKFIDFYNRLRALSHGKYKNAFIIDPETKKKYFLKIEITSSEE
jgi:dTDP-4-amino-4,6-dideoxyglucose formyltransferase